MGTWTASVSGVSPFFTCVALGRSSRLWISATTAKISLTKPAQGATSPGVMCSPHPDPSSTKTCLHSRPAEATEAKQYVDHHGGKGHWSKTDDWQLGRQGPPSHSGLLLENLSSSCKGKGQSQTESAMPSPKPHLQFPSHTNSLH